MDDILKIISQIPNILQFFIPGAFFVLIFTFFCSRTISNTYKVVLSCVISYVCLAVVNSIISAGFWGNVALSIALACVLAVIISLIVTCKWFKNLLVNTFYKSPHESVWRNVFDYGAGTNLRVYLKDKSYHFVGHYHSHEENGNDSWFCLSSHTKYDDNDNEIVNYSDDKNSFIIFNVRDVETIEAFQ